ncbi:MAG TPA: hypothetical protein VGO61_13520 [Steroidobacteraceae bacterium]|nr:hypothetical protein [Steroidobacteraceae bacterium]
MRMPTRKKESVFQQRREEWRKHRAAAQTLRSAFPAVELIRIELQFRDSTGRTPTAQSFVMHPPARAFFEYPCPYADCDGKFDLAVPATQVMSASEVHAHGALECGGLRSRDGLQRQPCGLHATYELTTQYLKEPGLKDTGAAK